jgi:hypothetical protein
MIKKLIEKLEIRKRQLIEGSAYPLHQGHHLRDIITVLAVLRNEPNAELLLENMPRKEDVKSDDSNLKELKKAYRQFQQSNNPKKQDKFIAICERFLT